ncbi:MAG TPA: hypothetical protein VN137_14240 [Sphingomonas sp.]|nr:hypothetical protein [Sphingomonas sp.]
MPFGQQCACCGSDRALPTSLFSPTNRYFFSGGGGDNIIRDWISYPLTLVKLIDRYAAQDGKTFDPTPVSAAASSMVDEHVKIGYLMGTWNARLGGMALTVNGG